MICFVLTLYQQIMCVCVCFCMYIYYVLCVCMYVLTLLAVYYMYVFVWMYCVFCMNVLTVMTRILITSLMWTLLQGPQLTNTLHFTLWKEDTSLMRTHLQGPKLTKTTYFTLRKDTLHHYDDAKTFFLDPVVPFYLYMFTGTCTYLSTSLHMLFCSTYCTLSIHLWSKFWLA